MFLVLARQQDVQSVAGRKWIGLGVLTRSGSTAVKGQRHIINHERHFDPYNAELFCI